jgi:hypothetical protein
MGQVQVAQVLTRQDIIGSYKVAELVTLARDGSPECWPLAPDFERGGLVFSTGYMYPTKAHNARRMPRVAALFSDRTASGAPTPIPWCSSRDSPRCSIRTSSATPSDTCINSCGRPRCHFAWR